MPNNTIRAHTRQSRSVITHVEVIMNHFTLLCNLPTLHQASGARQIRSHLGHQIQLNQNGEKTSSTRCKPNQIIYFTKSLHGLAKADNETET